MLLSFLTNQPSDGFCKCYGNIQYLSAQKALKAWNRPLCNIIFDCQEEMQVVFTSRE